MAEVVPFIFPPDRFPSFEPPFTHDFPPEDFGPPLRFDLRSPEYVNIPLEGNGFVIVPLRDEIAAKTLELTYSAADDKYYRPRISNQLPQQWIGWNECVWRCLNIDRKDERDWNMTYLAKKDNPGSAKLDGLIEWRFNLKAEGLKVNDLQVRVPYKLYRDGKVRVSVCSRSDYTILNDPQRLKSVVRATGWDDFVVRVELSGKTGDVVYQNAQLFRQPIRQDASLALPAEWAHPFKVVISMDTAG